MKLLTAAVPSAPARPFPAVMLEEKNCILPLSCLGFTHDTLQDFICADGKEELLPALRERLARYNGADLIPCSSLVRYSPIPRPAQDVICLGMNYAEHAVESARYKKEAFERNRSYAVYFSKRVNEAVPDGGDIPAHRDVTQRLDYEAELAVILGKDALNVPEEEAGDYIFGYTILNDISAREVQTLHKQWYLGKSLDGFCPMGPCIVTADEMEYPPVRKIRSYVNGELRQDSDTGMLMFSIGQIVADLSHGMLLKTGTIISTGTPAGVGMGFDPPRFLIPGDEVICEIEGIGTLTNRIAD